VPVTCPTPGSESLPLSFRSYVPLREIRLCDVDGVSDFFGVPGPSFGCGPAGGPLASGPVAGQGEDRGVQAGQRAAGAVAAVPAAGAGGDVGPDEPEDGGERDEAGVKPGGSGGAGSGGGGEVVDEQQRLGFLAGQVRGLAAQRAAGTADGPLEMQERDFCAAGYFSWSRRVATTRMRVVLVRPLRVRAVTVKVTSRAAVSGSRSARGSPAWFLRRVRMSSDSCSMTSSEPSGRVLTVLTGTDFAVFLIRQAR
jgi:hypothetical protein